MAATDLENALKNCLINFDCRINVTDLLQQYQLQYEEVNMILEKYLRKEESKGIKYAKRFLVQGVEKDNNNEVFTIVNGEVKLQEWLKQKRCLQNVQTALYSIEVAGGAKSPASIFKPLEKYSIALQSLTQQQQKAYLQPKVPANVAATDVTIKVEQKPEARKVKDNIFAMKTSSSAMGTSAINSSNKADSAASCSKSIKTGKKESPPSSSVQHSLSKKSSTASEENKNAASTKKGIANFFNAANAGSNIKKDSIRKDLKKDSTIVNDAKNNTPKPTKPATIPATAATTTKSTKESAANISLQLFDDESERSSSDEEEKLDALKRNIISVSDEEAREENDEMASGSSKRRRIVDSDVGEEEEDGIEKSPPQKIERRNSTENVNETDVEAHQSLSETYLDEDGFVVTIKKKKPNKAAIVGGKSVKAVDKKSPPMLTDVKATATAAATKTKQGNIKNFFSRK